ncbi:MAG: serine hydrolase [Candidatus Cryosericum sp.]
MKPDVRYVSVQEALQETLAVVSYPVAIHAQLLDADDRCLIFSQNSDLPFGAASIIKLPLLVCIGLLVSRGEMSWSMPVLLTVPEPHGTGLLEYMAGRDSASLHDLCVLMMGVSDNMACNQLLEVIGMERANELLHELGYTATRFRRMMMDRETLARGMDNTVTAEEVADMLARLHARQLISGAVSERILTYLRMNQLHDLIAWPLPGSATLWGKTGGMPGSLLDAELVAVSGGSEYSVCFFASGFERAAQVKRLIAQVSEIIYGAVAGKRCADCP